MKTLIAPDRTTINVLAERLKRSKGRPEFQRIQCVLIRATLGSTASEIARLLGWSAPTLHVIHSGWAKEGDAILDLKAGRDFDPPTTSPPSPTCWGKLDLTPCQA